MRGWSSSGRKCSTVIPDDPAPLCSSNSNSLAGMKSLMSRGNGSRGTGGRLEGSFNAFKVCSLQCLSCGRELAQLDQHHGLLQPLRIRICETSALPPSIHICPILGTLSAASEQLSHSPPTNMSNLLANFSLPNVPSRAFLNRRFRGSSTNNFQPLSCLAGTPQFASPWQPSWPCDMVL